jgi:hypothetical protein
VADYASQSGGSVQLGFLGLPRQVGRVALDHALVAFITLHGKRCNVPVVTKIPVRIVRLSAFGQAALVPSH